MFRTKHKKHFNMFRYKNTWIKKIIISDNKHSFHSNSIWQVPVKPNHLIFFIFQTEMRVGVHRIPVAKAVKRSTAHCMSSGTLFMSVSIMTGRSSPTFCINVGTVFPRPVTRPIKSVTAPLIKSGKPFMSASHISVIRSGEHRHKLFRYAVQSVKQTLEQHYCTT